MSLKRLRNHFAQQSVGYAALIIALGGGTAYAAGTIRSQDIVDDSITSADIMDARRVGHQQLGGLKTSDIQEDAVITSRLADNSVSGNGGGRMAQSSGLDGSGTRGRKLA